jgi:UDP-N-acetylmuramyl pentapeptide phosphotransferase/UDP-N-acetylglucosamine-1-phosphate transferase
MNPKYRPALLFGIAFVLMAPYLGFVMYYSQQFPPNQWPAWFTNTIAVWFLANFLIIFLLVKRMFRGQAVDAEKARRAAEKSVRTSTRLVILWSLLFLYGVKETIQGKIPLGRAIPAGVLLLVFIGIFGWEVYRAKREKV